MIGKIIIGKSFRGCISYCLEKERAELIAQQFCYGQKKEIIAQFSEVRQLNPKLSKPVMHLSLSLAPGERLTHKDQHRLVEAAAVAMGYDKNQWIAIAHHDTGHAHLHIVINRVGFDGKTLSDSNNYKKIAQFCRQMEKELGLLEVQSPRRFLNREEQKMPRLDQRKKRLEKVVLANLAKARDYKDFENRMNGEGYTVIRARGIRFIDAKKVKTKGSEIGFSLQRIEKLLALDRLQRTLVLEQITKGKTKLSAGMAQHKMEAPKNQQPEKNKSLEKNLTEAMKITSTVLSPRSSLQPDANPGLIKKKKRRRHL